MQLDDAAWLDAHPAGAVDDFLAICERCVDAWEGAGAQRPGALAHGPDAGWPTAGELRASLRHARAADWAQLDHELAHLAARCARDGAAPRALATQPYRTLAAATVERHAAEPARLTQALVVLGDGLARWLEVLARAGDPRRPPRAPGDAPEPTAGDPLAARTRTQARRADVSSALYEHALEQAQFGIIISNTDTRAITSVNSGYAELVGYRPEELLGTTGEQLIAPDSQPAVPSIASTLRERGHHTFTLRLLRKDGTTVPVLASSSTVATPSGARMRVTTVVDISERDQFEQDRAAASRAVEQSAARLAALSGAAHEFAVESGELEPLLTLVARRIGQIVGEGCVVRLISRDGAWLDPTASFYHPDPRIREFVRPLLGTERQRLGEGLSGRVAATGVPALIPVVEPDLPATLAPSAFQPIVSRVGLASLLAVPLRSRDRTIGVITLTRSQPGNPYTVDDQHFAQDLADRAGLAIDNAVLVATLEQQVTERTAALEAANRELEAFSYSASHDLRTPLRAIDGFSQILLDDYQGSLDAGGLGYLRRIRAATQRMGALIEDLLKLSRINRVTLNVAVHDLSAIAAEVIAELERREPARAVAVHIEPGLAVRADARLLRILLDNLLGNAWKFTARHDPAQIWVGAEAGAYYVRDTGAGFDMAYAAKLFVPFQRLHIATEYDGTGIGLAIVQRIVAHHCGRIWASSEVGKGATFFFTLGTNVR